MAPPPEIAGKGIANPNATLWSVQMILDFPGQAEAAAALTGAIEAVTGAGYFTPDIGGSDPLSPSPGVCWSVCKEPSDNEVRRSVVSFSRFSKTWSGSQAKYQHFANF